MDEGSLHSFKAQSTRFILHIDLDCFYCQVEAKRLKIPPEVPLAVQQWQGLIAVNYAAKEKGIRRFTKVEEAQQLCPELVLVHVEVVTTEGLLEDAESPEKGLHKASLRRYREASNEIFDIFQRFSPLCERASIDEAYLDVTELVLERAQQIVYGGKLDFNSEMDHLLALAGEISKEIRETVFRELGYTCSAGIAHNKMLAKIASPMNKPNKQTVVPLKYVKELMEQLPFRNIRGLGGKLGTSLEKQNVGSTAGDISRWGLNNLRRVFGDKTGTFIYRKCLGLDDDAVVCKDKPKSILAAKSFSATNTYEELESWVHVLTTEMEARLKKDHDAYHRTPRTFVAHFRKLYTKSRSHSCPMPRKTDKKDLTETTLKLLKSIPPTDLFPCVHISISVTSFVEVDEKSAITTFFSKDTNPCPSITPPKPFHSRDGETQTKSKKPRIENFFLKKNSRDLEKLPVVRPRELRSPFEENDATSATSLCGVSGSSSASLLSNSAPSSMSTIKCSDCGAELEILLAQEHADFHFAMNLSKSMNQNNSTSEHNKVSPSADAQRSQNTQSKPKGIKAFFARASSD